MVHYGWHSIFFIAGVVGMGYAGVWAWAYREPTESKRINAAELKVLHDGGATYREAVRSEPFEWSALRALLLKRDLWGVYLTKFFFSAAHAFYFTWFPHYLVTAKHMTLITAGLWAMIPYLVSMLGMLAADISPTGCPATSPVTRSRASFRWSSACCSAAGSWPPTTPTTRWWWW